MSSATEPADTVGPVRHIVSFGFKDCLAKERLDAIVAAFAALPSQIPQIQNFEWGTNISKEGLTKGLTHCWILDFKNYGDLKIYLACGGKIENVNQRDSGLTLVQPNDLCRAKNERTSEKTR